MEMSPPVEGLYIAGTDMTGSGIDLQQVARSARDVNAALFEEL